MDRSPRGGPAGLGTGRARRAAGAGGQRRRRARRPPGAGPMTRGRWPGRRPPIRPAGLAGTGPVRRGDRRCDPGRHPSGVRTASGRSSPTSWRRSPAPTTAPGWATSRAARPRTPTSSARTPRSTSTPEAIHAIGLEEIDRIDAEFAELGRAAARHARPAETLARLRSDPALHFATRDEVFETAEASLRPGERGDPGLVRAAAAGAPATSSTMGDHEAKHSTIAYYRQPAADGSRPGSYYINTTLPETRPRYEAEALAFHEAVPGHHLQLAIAQELDDLPAFRRLGGPTASSRAGASTRERLADEMGLYSGRPRPVRVLSFDAWRACRLVVDTGMHALGWSRDQAIDFMLEHTALGREQHRQRGRPLHRDAGPGAGLQARPARDPRGSATRPRTRSASAFDIRAFHDAVLGQGAVGLRTLARRHRGLDRADVRLTSGRRAARRRRGQCENEWSTFRRRSTRQCRTLCSIDG